MDVFGSGSLPIDFVGKTERIAEDWKTFMESHKCDAASTPFSNSLGQHPTDGFLDADAGYATIMIARIPVAY